MRYTCFDQRNWLVTLYCKTHHNKYVSRTPNGAFLFGINPLQQWITYIIYRLEWICYFPQLLIFSLFVSISPFIMGIVVLASISLWKLSWSIFQIDTGTTLQIRSNANCVLESINPLYIFYLNPKILYIATISSYHPEVNST